MFLFTLKHIYYKKFPPFTYSFTHERFPSRKVLYGFNKAAHLVRKIYTEGAFKKAGIMASELAPAGVLQANLFEDTETLQRRDKLMEVVDRLNARMGKQTLRFAAACGDANENWRTKAAFKSRAFTTSWDELLTISLK